VRAGGALSLPLLVLAAVEGANGLRAEFALADYFRSGLADRAALERAKRLAPRDGKIAAMLGRDLDGREPRDPARALEMFDLALRLRPNDPAALENRGILHAKEGRFEAARADLERARALNPHHPRILRNLEELERLERGGR
jgi:Flp pilus assembly protein TadD